MWKRETGERKQEARDKRQEYSKQTGLHRESANIKHSETCDMGIGLLAVLIEQYRNVGG